MKRVSRSKTDRRIAGICGGLGAYFGVDSMLIRVAFVFGAVLVGLVPAVIAYIVAAIILPEEGEEV